MTFAELVQSKLPTRYLGARIEKVERCPDCDGVRAAIEGYGTVIVSGAEMHAAKVNSSAEKWSALRAVLGVETAAAPGDPVPLPDPEPPPTPEPPRPTAFRDEWREPTTHRVIAAVELGMESLRAAMRRTVERGLTRAGLMTFDNGDCASEGFFVWKCPSAKIAEFTAREYQDPIRDRWLIATSYKQDGCLLVWKLTREPTVAERDVYRGIDRSITPEWKASFDAAKNVNIEQAMNETWAAIQANAVKMRWNTILDVDPALPPGSAELRGERDVARICNVDVPPADLEDVLERSEQNMLKRFYEAYFIPAKKLLRAPEHVAPDPAPTPRSSSTRRSWRSPPMDSPGDSGLRCFQGGWGCGFCGNIGEPTPYCCAQGREWARRFIATLGIPAHAESTEITLEERHLDARWGRVLRRWRAKAGSGAPPLENASDP